ncbi:MAG: ACT domain-containing protein [Caldilineaceae bacterium]
MAAFYFATAGIFIMAGIHDLTKLLKFMSPQLMDGEFVICTVSGKLADYLHLEPLGTFQEREGATLVLEKGNAVKGKLTFESTFKMITLTVHSSLDAVGLTAAVSTKLASKGISANVIAAYYHDHIFVQSEKAEMALSALEELCK